MIWGPFGVISKSFGCRLGAFWEILKHVESHVDFYQFWSFTGRLLGTLLEIILHLGGHVWRFSRQKCRRFMVTVFIWSRGPPVDRPMCSPYGKYCSE